MFSKKNLLIRIVFLILFLIFTRIGVSQNIIPNNSFENHERNNNKWESFYKPTDWKVATPQTTPEYYHSQKERFKSIKHNPEKTLSKSGKRFVGLHLFYAEHQEYIQTSFIDKLMKDSLYCFKLNIRVSENAGLSIDKIGLLFSKQPLYMSQSQLLQYTPNIILNTSLVSKKEWLEIGGVYKSNGSEKHMVIGLFDSNPTITSLPIKDKKKRKARLDKNKGAYYLIDDIFLYKISHLNECDCEVLDTNYFNKKNEPFANIDLQKKIEKVVIKESIPITPLKEKALENTIIKEEKGSNKEYIIYKLYFDWDNHHLNYNDIETLKKVLDILNNNDDIEVVKLLGHTDLTGQNDYNYKLSMRRTEVVATYLKENLKNKTLEIETLGLGEERPAIKDNNQKNQALNRRVEIIIKKKS
jgi:outer membrane protein OmpA-like peptidoglycan-associated protein